MIAIFVTRVASPKLEHVRSLTHQFAHPERSDGCRLSGGKPRRRAASAKMYRRAAFVLSPSMALSERQLRRVISVREMSANRSIFPFTSTPPQSLVKRVRVASFSHLVLLISPDWVFQHNRGEFISRVRTAVQSVPAARNYFEGIDSR